MSIALVPAGAAGLAGRPAPAFRPAPGASWPERVVARLAAALDRILGRPVARDGGHTRRSFLVRVSLFATAVAVGPVRFLLRPGSAYASVCGPSPGCDQGWTAFCCTINDGRNACPEGSFAAGWWKNDNSSFCGGKARYIIDCNASCPTRCTCRCSGSSTCDQRKTCCNQFRYGQCHQEIACSGPVVCRIAICTLPWEFEPTCSTALLTDNRTNEHGAPCILGIDDPVDDVFAFDVPDLGSPAGAALARPLVGMDVTPDGGGYWLVASDGGIFTYGNAGFAGSAGAIALRRPIVGMAATPSGGGYWLVASDGGIFSYGDAPFFGSAGDIALRRPIVGMAATPTGRGYWLVASDGGIFTFGDAPFLGSTGDQPWPSRWWAWPPPRPDAGYWLVASDGGIFSFGDAVFHGSTGGPAPQPARRGHGGHGHRRRLLAGGRRRRHLHLWRRGVPRCGLRRRPPRRRRRRHGRQARHPPRRRHAPDRHPADRPDHDGSLHHDRSPHHDRSSHHDRGPDHHHQSSAPAHDHQPTPAERARVLGGRASPVGDC